jgi:prophage regulatory protein
MDQIDRLLNVNQVMELLGIKSRCTLWKWVRNGKFPAPVSLNGSLIRWWERDVTGWMNSRPTQRY